MEQLFSVKVQVNMEEQSTQRRVGEGLYGHRRQDQNIKKNASVAHGPDAAGSRCSTWDDKKPVASRYTMLEQPQCNRAT